MLVADGRVTVDALLEAGQVNETVNVTAEAGETVNTTSGEIARVVDGQQVQNLALNGRNFLQLATLIPGAPLLDFDAIAQTTSNSGTIAVNGSRSDSNNLTVDGGFNLLKANNSAPANNVGVDFIQEVKIQTSNFSAEHGRQSGAAINVTTRSGGNQLHGSVFEFLRNDKLDARNFFATGVRKLRFNDFDYSVGGPVIKNKFFFFGGQEWKYIRRTLDPARRTLPTSADLRGDLSFRLRGADGIVGTADDGALRDPCLQLWDLSLRKRFALTEQWRLQFQADFFNLFNKANFLNVATTVTNADFGTVTTAAPERNIQLALRLTF